MIDKNKIAAVVENFLEGSDCFLVGVSVSPSNDIVIDIDSDTTVDIDLCCKINALIDENFSRDEEDYSLEVGSAGFTAPFKVLRQYQKYVGQEVETLAEGKKYVGVLQSVDENGFTIVVSKKQKGKKEPIVEMHTFSFSQVKYTKYNFKFN